MAGDGQSSLTFALPYGAPRRGQPPGSSAPLVGFFLRGLDITMKKIKKIKDF